MPDSNPFTIVQVLQRVLPVAGRRRVTIDGYRQAGVLVPVVVTKEGIELLLTRRTEDVETHKGQISFPGGMADATDADIVQTALRETREELGIESPLVEIMGLLDDLATPTGFIITPVVGVLRSLPPLTPNPKEVAEAFTVPLEFFRIQGNARMEMREFLGEKREVWYYERGGHTIWGATAIIIRSLISRLDPAEQRPVPDPLRS